MPVFHCDHFIFICKYEQLIFSLENDQLATNVKVFLTQSLHKIYTLNQQLINQPTYNLQSFILLSVILIG